jgi:hypothetical protein
VASGRRSGRRENTRNGARHPDASIVEMLDLVFRGIRKEACLTTAPDDDEDRMDAMHARRAGKQRVKAGFDRRR